MTRKSSLRAVGLFSGIGGFELGFREAGISTELVCEIDALTTKVLTERMAEQGEPVPCHDDVRTLTTLPEVDVLVGGFPCQNLSLVGKNDGIMGAESRLVDEVFRLASISSVSPKWLVLENVPFMLWHRRGEAIRYVTAALESMGFVWAYRVVDARAFGVPQRRRRVIIVASRSEDPREVLFADNYAPNEMEDDGNVSCGFSWTEGKYGLGWAVNCTPTLKAGSGVGVPSPPAIWVRHTNEIVTPNIRDAERLQGFEAGWTESEIDGKAIKLGARWKMIGNAIPTSLAEWVGGRLVEPGALSTECSSERWEGRVWPNAAYGKGGQVWKINATEWPASKDLPNLDDFLTHETPMLSERASRGFLKRAREGKLRFREGFLDAIESHAESMAKNKVAA